MPIRSAGRNLQKRVIDPRAVLQIKDRRNELGSLRVAKVTGGAPNKLAKMCAANFAHAVLMLLPALHFHDLPRTRTLVRRPRLLRCWEVSTLGSFTVA